MRSFLCLVLVSGILDMLLPEGNACRSVRMITGLIGIKMIAQLIFDSLLNFL